MNEFMTIKINSDCDFAVDENFKCPRERRSNRKISLKQLENLARGGCPMCILCCNALETVAPEILGDPALLIASSTPLNLSIYDASGDIFMLGINFAAPSGATLSFHFPDYQFHNTRFVPDMQQVPRDTSPEKSMEFARRCIETCNKEHTCMRNHTFLYMPRRVIDIRDDTVRLLETADTHVTTGYACLSHCWGNEWNMLRTTASNLRSFKKSIAWNSLPRTFQDAISAARQLKVFYLWVDALCIIQDDPLDWQQQSAVMADIYQNAYITLAAAASSDSSGGCAFGEGGTQSLQTRKHLALGHLSDGTTRKLYPVRTPSHYPTNLPLLKRGWVYQERILSPRILYFTRDELIWECHAGLDCECGEKRGKYSDWRRAPLRPKDTQMSSWMEVLRQYTASSLTYPSDAFPALSGITKVYQRVYDDTYVAGMWQRCLPAMLLWHFDTGPGVVNINTSTWRAPSWSWASQNWNKELKLLPCTKGLAKISSVVCEPFGADPTGRLATAHLTLTTKAIPACLQLHTTGAIAQYVVKLKHGPGVIQASESLASWDMLETSHCGLSDPRLAAGTQALDIVIAQIGNFAGANYLPTIFGVVSKTKKIVKSCMLLAQHSEHTDQWVRVGLAAITDSDPYLAIGDVEASGGYDSDQSGLDEEEVLRENVWVAFEERRNRSHDIFRQFDEAPMQDFIVL